jgi:hypothetical protein
MKSFNDLDLPLGLFDIGIWDLGFVLTYAMPVLRFRESTRDNGMYQLQ